MAIAVTGATGYLGGRIAARLETVGVSPVGRPGRAGGVDLTDRRQVLNYFKPGRFETVIHCAAAVPKCAAGYADEEAGARSLEMVENILAAAPRNIVFASSMTVYPANAKMPVREEDAGGVDGGYAGFKRRAEIALQSADGANVTMFRLPGLFGPPRENGLLYNAARELAEERVPDLPAPAPMWAAMHVDDAADLIVRAAIKPLPGTVILNAGYDCAMSVTKTVADIAALFGISIPAGTAPVFRMDLTRLKQTIGLPGRTLDERLSELVTQARALREKTLA